ncbi:hypothetical protein [Salinibacter sp.]|uniref:hypothetical protein n=1 Tax=Salinibacter sp. TaxID=2065818 RepID=UPI0035D51DE1
MDLPSWIRKRPFSSGGRLLRAPWFQVSGAFVLLNGLLQLPTLLFGTLPAELTVTRPTRLYYLLSLDLFGLFVFLALVPRSSKTSWVEYAMAGSILFLLVYETYDAAVLSTLGRSPILYADAPHAIGALHLARNVDLTWLQVAGIGGAAGGLGVLAWGLPALIRRVHRHVRSPSVRKQLLGGALIVGGLVLVESVPNRGVERRTYQTVCYSTTECLVRNVQASTDLNRQVLRRQQQEADSTYARYDDLQWTHRPSLYLVMIESYGSALTVPSDPSGPHASFMRRMGDSLRATGWHAATARSKAPVFGGLSWLSMGTLLLGTPVRHQPTFDVLRRTLPRYPHLVRVLEQQGYTTAALQPPVRTRAGLPVRNLYGFDRTFYLQDLEYRGPDYGWGIVPDQYSLAVAHQRFVVPTTGPLFLFFETVTPHAPWADPPPPFLKGPGNFYPPTLSSHYQAEGQGPARPRARTNTLSQREHLRRRIQYDWRVLSDYLRTQAPSNSLVVVLGDHQPYTAETESRATPVHVLSRDSALVGRFRKHGLRSGLRPSPASDTLHHAGMYSLLIRVLTVHDRGLQEQPVRPAPSYRPRGVGRPALLPERPK